MSLSTDSLLRLPQVLARLSISRSHWWRGIQEGRFPQGIKLSPRVTVWRESEIDRLIQALGN